MTSRKQTPGQTAAGAETDHLARLSELAALQEISRSLQTLNLDEILRLVLDGVTKTIGFDRAPPVSDRGRYTTALMQDGSRHRA